MSDHAGLRLASTFHLGRGPRGERRRRLAPLPSPASYRVDGAFGARRLRESRLRFRGPGA